MPVLMSLGTVRGATMAEPVEPRRCCGCDEPAEYYGYDGELYCKRHVRMSGLATRQRIHRTEGEAQ
jgi:hypothetical protein